MITGAEVGLGIQALKAAMNIAKDAKDLTDTTAIRGKIIEMQSLILEAQAGAIEAREAHSAQASRIRELEDEVAHLKTWDAEKSRYELQKLEPGSFAYALKPNMANGEPPHHICTACYQHGKKSILHGESSGWWETLKCLECDSEIRARAIPISL